jgi:glyoxylase I family protein
MSSPPIQPAAEVIGIDHLYLSVSHLARAESFYDMVLAQVLGFRKSSFELGGEPHRQYYNRHYGIVLRPARVPSAHEPYAPGLHHLCLRVATVDEVKAVAQQLQALGLNASPAACYPDYAPDYWATYFSDPDGIRLEVTNYRQERRERHDHWDTALGGRQGR